MKSSPAALVGALFPVILQLANGGKFGTFLQNSRLPLGASRTAFGVSKLLTIPRGGEEAKEGSVEDQGEVLYLPGLLDTVIHKSDEVRL